MAEESPRILSYQAARDRIVNLLKERGPLTTREIVELSRRDRVQCPDGPVKFLVRLRAEDVIKGEVSMIHKGWVWWIE